MVLRILDAALANRCHALGVVPDGLHVRKIVGWLWRLDDLLPAPEANVGEQRRQSEVLRELEARHAHELGVIRLVGCRTGCIEGDLARAFHGRGKPQEMVIVRHVAERIDAGRRLADRKVGVVSRDRLLVRDHGIVEAADPRINVRWHVDEVT